MKEDVLRKIDEALAENKEVISKYWYSKVMDLVYNPTQAHVNYAGIVDVLERRPGDPDWYEGCYEHAHTLLDTYDRTCASIFENESWLDCMASSCTRCRTILWNQDEHLIGGVLIHPYGHFNSPCWTGDAEGTMEYYASLTQELVDRCMEYSAENESGSSYRSFFSFK